MSEELNVSFEPEILQLAKIQFQEVLVVVGGISPEHADQVREQHAELEQASRVQAQTHLVTQERLETLLAMQVPKSP